MYKTAFEPPMGDRRDRGDAQISTRITEAHRNEPTNVRGCHE